MAAQLATRRTLTTLTRTFHAPPPTARAHARSSLLARLAAPLSLLPSPNPAVHNATRPKTTSGSGYSPLNDPSPNWSNRPPKETILLDGCDYEHWLIVMEFPEDPKPSEEEMINAYVRTLAAVVGSEEEAKKKIYSVCTTTYTGFGCLISEELSYKVKAYFGSFDSLQDRAVTTLLDLYMGIRKEYRNIINSSRDLGLTFISYLGSEIYDRSMMDFLQVYSQPIDGLPGVLWVLPDSYLDVPNKDYGGDLFIDGKVIHRPQYWYNERQQVRRPRPRYDRRRETMQVDRNRDLGNRGNWVQNRPDAAQPQASAEGQNSVLGGREAGGDNV